MKEEGVQRAILVISQQLTPFAKQCLNEMSPKYLIEQVRYTQQSYTAYIHSIAVVHVQTPPG